MTTLITRLYATSKDASAIADALAANLFKNKHFDVITMPGDKKLSAKAARAAINAEMSRAGVIPRSSAVYADMIVEGNALVVVRAPVGASQAAKAVLNEFPSIDAGVRDEVHIPAEVNRPVKRHRPSATSLLARDAMILSGKKFLPPLTSSQRTISQMLGLPLLSRNGPRAKLVSGSTTPFSSMLGLPLLSKSRN